MLTEINKFIARRIYTMKMTFQPHNKQQKREVPRGVPNPLAMFVFSSSARCDLLTLRYSPPQLVNRLTVSLRVITH